jgi:hypothetical protein
MGMSKEQQKAASDRIMAKFPLDEQERQTYEMLAKRPEDYRVPGEKRECGVCGAVFQEIPATKESRAVSALEQFLDHQAEHNPSPAQWSEAHSQIEQGKEAAKKAT